MRNKWLFLIGAPKCGTTSVANWLNHHGNIKLAESKEPGFFRTGKRKWILDAHFPDQFQVRDESDYMSDRAEYERQFGECDADVWRLDASTDYMSDTGSADRIRNELDQDTVRFICVLRDPIERMYSEYCHTIRDDCEILSFEDAIMAEERRIEEGYQPLFFHAERSKYWKHISRWRSVFGEDRFLILPFSIISDFSSLEKRVCEFLQIPMMDLGEIPKLNASASKPEPRVLSKRFVSLKRIIKTTLGLEQKARRFVFPEFTEESKRLAFSIIKQDVEQCVADRSIPTSEWTTSLRLLSR